MFSEILSLYKFKMMRKLILLILISFPLLMLSQNLQFHYDFGKANDGDAEIKREYLTVTLDYFKPDKLGSTFLFVDIDFDKTGGGASLAYFEIARKFTLDKKSGIAFQIEYNDGTPDYLRSAWLAGLCYPLKIGNVTIHTSLLYKAIKGASSPDGQLTLVWHQSLFKNKLLFTGFIDIWTQDEIFGDGKNIVFLSEPQLWYVLNDHFSFGSEIEISKNLFTFDGDFEVMPTIAFKWVF